MPLRAALAAVALLLLLPNAAGAFVVQERLLASSTNGIVLGPDGNLWVAEFDAGSVARVTPAGQVLGHTPVGANPTSIAVGPGGMIWVSVTGADKLVRIDPAVPAVATPVPTVSACGPVAIVDGGNGRMYFSTPASGDCPTSGIGSVRASDGGDLQAVTGLGTAFDLAVSGGKLFVPDFLGDVVRRVNPATLTTELTIGGLAPGSQPDGIAADGAGNLWVTLWGAGTVARFPASAAAATVLPPPGGFANPFGIVAGADGRIYATGSGNPPALVRSDPATNVFTRYGLSGAPWQIVNGPDGDLYFTDVDTPRFLRFVNDKPRATTGEARATAPTAGSAGAKVDARGNATTVVFDYGTTTAYGSTTAPVTVPEGVGEVDVRSDLTALAPNTTYHVRVRAANAEGETLGADTVVTTPLPPPAELPASAKYGWRFSSTWTQLTKVVVRRLRAGDTVKLTCKGKGCGVKKKTRQATGAKMKLTRYFGRKHKLRKGVRVRITVTAPNAIGIVSRLDVRRGKDPRISRRCLPPGATKPQRCSG
jgi:streptogramin lyase